MTSENQKSLSWLENMDRVLSSGSRWIYALFVGAFLLKLLYILQSADALHVRVPIMDSAYYDNTARDIVKGHMLRDRAFFMGPLYPYFLASIFSVFGHSIMVVRLAQIAGGALVVVLSFLIGRQVFRPSVAFAGAGMLALYGTATFYEGQLLMMWLGTLLNMGALYLLLKRSGDGLKRYVAVGILLGLSALARANILVFVPVVLVWLVMVSGETRRVAKALALLAATLAVVSIATIHNFAAERDFVPITSNGGFNFYIGNSPAATGIFYPPKGINLTNDNSVHQFVERELGRELKSSEASRYWYGEAFNFIKVEPGRAFRLFLKKTAMLLNGYEVPQIESYEYARTQYGSLRILFMNFWMLMGLGLLGMIYLTSAWKKYFLLYGYVWSFSLSIIVFFITARYRVQIVPVLALFAAYALIEVFPKIIENLKRRPQPLLLFLLIMFLSRPSIFALPKDDVRWRSLTHEARRLSQTGDGDAALAKIDEAIALRPDYADSYIHRAIIHKAKDDLFRAIGDYSRAVEIAPNIASVRYDLAQALRQVKMYEPAAEEYLATIELSPRMTEAYNNLGITYREMKQYEKAAEYFNKVIELDPGYTKAYNNLGASIAEAGNLDQAVPVFKKAIEVDPNYANSYKNLAMVYIQLRRVADAYDRMSEYLERNPRDANAREILDKLRVVLQGDTTGVDPQ